MDFYKGDVMKTILALTTALALGTAYAQTPQKNSPNSTNDYFKIAPQQQQAAEGQRHMVEFNGDFIPTFIYSLERSKTKGSEADNESGANLKFNYAYTLHPNLQVGGKLSYFNGVSGNTDQEEMTLSAAAWFNTKAGDLQNSPYISVALGTGWAQTYGSNGGRDDLWLASIAFGKRFALDNLGIKHVSYTPEIAFVNENSTTNSNFDYRQATEFRLLQFSVLW